MGKEGRGPQSRGASRRELCRGRRPAPPLVDPAESVACFGLLNSWSGQNSEGSKDDRPEPDRFLEDETMATASEIAAVGVIGAGQMGSGIAQLAAAAGCAVLLLDADSAALSRAVASISASLRRLAAKGQLSQTACEDSIKRIRCVSTVQDLRDADLVIEAIVENEDVKKQLFVELDEITKASAILASNTSSISITRLASATKRPSQVIGMHFFNPPPCGCSAAAACQVPPCSARRSPAAAHHISSPQQFAGARPSSCSPVELLEAREAAARRRDAQPGGERVRGRRPQPDGDVRRWGIGGGAVREERDHRGITALLQRRRGPPTAPAHRGDFTQSSMAGRPQGR